MRRTLLVLVALSCALSIAVTRPSDARAAEPDVDLVNQTWTCNKHMTGQWVRVIVTDDSSPGNAIKLDPGCSGELIVSCETKAADCVKVAASWDVHDLRVRGYSYQHATANCGPGGKHADATHVMGSRGILFDGYYSLQTTCSGAAPLFVNGWNDTPPVDVVCDGCTLARQGQYAAHVNGSTNGVRNSRIFAWESPATRGSGFYSNNDIRIGQFDMAALLAEGRAAAEAAAGGGDPDPPPPPPDPVCSDGLDNDGDGKIDYPQDPGCTSADDGDETDPEPPPPPGEDPFLDEVQAVEQIVHDSSKYPKVRVADIEAIVHGLSGDTACADKLERVDVVVHGSGWPQAKLEDIHAIDHEAGECAV